MSVGLNHIDREIRRSEARLQRLEDRRMQLEAMGEDVYQDGAVLMFTHRFASKSIGYRYVAVKCGDLWHLTGRREVGGAGRSWSALVGVIFRSDAELVDGVWMANGWDAVAGS